MNEKFELKGVLVDREKDPRDYTISMFIPGQDIIKDEEFCLKLPEIDFILNQYHFNSCVGHSFALCKSILEYQRTNKWLDIDPYTIYGTRYDNEYDGMGMYPYQGAKVLRNEGAFLRRDFGIQAEVPELITKVKNWKQVNPKLVEAAKDLQIEAWYYVDNNNAIKTALKNGMPISVAYPLYNSFYNIGVEGIVFMPTEDDELLGYHQMTIVGWTKNNYWIVLNSWGNKYGFKGVYLIPFEYSYNSAIAVTDTITPIKYKAKEIEFIVGSKYFTVDGVKKEFDSIPYIKNDRTYVSVRFITEALGASVEWLPETQNVIIRSEECNIKLEIGSKKFVLNDEDIDWNDVAPEIVNNRTMLPVRMIAEYLNCKVLWDDGIVKIKAL